MTIILAAAVIFAGASCKREERTFRVEPPYVSSVAKIPLTSFFAGNVAATQPAISNEYEQNAKRLFLAMNCNGCHANGGGGIGPPLIDDKWIYGSDPGQVFATIVQGRPNGMPSFATKLPDHQVWQLAGYVRSMSGLTRKDAAPGRADHMHSKPPAHSIDERAPQQGGTTPPSTEMPR